MKSLVNIHIFYHQWNKLIQFYVFQYNQTQNFCWNFCDARNSTFQWPRRQSRGTYCCGRCTSRPSTTWILPSQRWTSCWLAGRSPIIQETIFSKNSKTHSPLTAEAFHWDHTTRTPSIYSSEFFYKKKKRIKILIDFFAHCFLFHKSQLHFCGARSRFQRSSMDRRTSR